MTSKICSRKSVPDREDYRKIFDLQKCIQELPQMEKSSENPKLGSVGTQSPWVGVWLIIKFHVVTHMGGSLLGGRPPNNKPPPHMCCHGMFCTRHQFQKTLMVLTILSKSGSFARRTGHEFATKLPKRHIEYFILASWLIPSTTPWRPERRCSVFQRILSGWSLGQLKRCVHKLS